MLHAAIWVVKDVFLSSHGYHGFHTMSHITGQSDKPQERRRNHIITQVIKNWLQETTEWTRWDTQHSCAYENQPFDQDEKGRSLCGSICFFSNTLIIFKHFSPKAYRCGQVFSDPEGSFTGTYYDGDGNILECLWKIQPSNNLPIKISIDYVE